MLIIQLVIFSWLVTGVSGEVTAQNVCLLASWLIDHPITDDSDGPTSPTNAGVEPVEQLSESANTETVVGSTRAPLARDRWDRHWQVMLLCNSCSLCWLLVTCLQGQTYSGCHRRPSICCPSQKLARLSNIDQYLLRNTVMLMALLLLLLHSDPPADWGDIRVLNIKICANINFNSN